MTTELFNKNIIKSSDVDEYAHWPIPYVGEKSHRVQTVEEIEKSFEDKRKSAEKKGYEKGYEEGCQKGEKEAYQKKSSELNELIETFNLILQGLNDPISEFSKEIEAYLLTLLKSLFLNCTGKEISVNPDLLIQIISSCLAEMPMNNDKKLIYLNETDKKILDDFIASSQGEDFLNKHPHLVFNVSSELNSGEVKIDSNKTSIDATIDARIKNLLYADETV